MISEREWAALYDFVEKQISKRGQYFVTGTVVKRDSDKGLIWLSELGDQPIPIVGFDLEVKYYDTDNAGITTQKKAKVKTLVPQIGQSVLVARELGVDRIPRCLGVIQGTDWIIQTED